MLLGYVCFVFRFCLFIFKQKTAYDLRISDWSSDVCSSDLGGRRLVERGVLLQAAGLRHRIDDAAGRHLIVPEYKSVDEALRLFVDQLGLTNEDVAHVHIRLGSTGGDKQSLLAGRARNDRQIVEKGKSVSLRVDHGGA